MIRFYCLLVLLLFGKYAPIYAATLPVPLSFDKTKPRQNSKEELDGIKRNKLRFLLKQKIGLLHPKHFLPHIGSKEATPKQLKQGKWSMVLGLLGVAAIFIPYGVIFVLPLAVAAIILGRRSVKGNNNKYGRTGFIAGIVAIVVLLAAVIILAALYSGGIW